MPTGISYKTEEERKAAKRASQAKYRAENREKRKASCAKWRAGNKEKIAQWKEKNKEKHKAQAAKWRAEMTPEQREKSRAASARYAAKNREKVLARRVQWRKERKDRNPNVTYKITCVPAQKSYVGMTTVSFNTRKGDHLRRLRNKKHPNPRLQSAYDQHGEESLKFETIREFPPETSRQQMLDYEEEDIIKVIVEERKIYNKLSV